MSALESVALFLAGLVFFFTGLDGIKSSLKALASRSMRRRAAAATSSPLRAALAGMGFGAVSQSATAVSFVVAGLVSARLLPIGRALSVVAWANPGTAALAFLAAIDVNLAALWLLGIAGLALRIRRLGTAAGALGAFVGIALLLYGLGHLKRAAEPVQEAEWFAAASVALNGSLLLGFLAGALLRLVIQSSSGIVVILIALSGKGLLHPEQALMVIHGTGAGVGLSVLLLGQGLRGEALRIAYWQAIVNAGSAILMAGWLLLAGTGVLPSIPRVLLSFGTSLESVLALGFLVQMLLCPAIGALLRRRSQEILARLAPEAAEAELAKPAFLSEAAADEPELAIELVGREQSRILAAAPALLDRGRLDRMAASGLEASSVRKSLDELSGEITGFLGEALDRATGETGHLLLPAIARQQALSELVESLDALGAETGALPADSTARDLCGTLVESADAIVRTLGDALASGDSLDREILGAMTADRGEQMESIRGSAAAGTLGAPRERASVLYATALFERIVYLSRRIGAA